MKETKVLRYKFSHAFDNFYQMHLIQLKACNLSFELLTSFSVIVMLNRIIISYNFKTLLYVESEKNITS